jgi:ABC-type antimicrobial peptide transport system permease subunit
VVDIFYESMRARREEFGLYRLAGMSHSELRLMKRSELIVTVLIGVLIGIVMFVISAFAINRGVSGIGVEIFLGIKQLFI